jgi:hypothetical protein
VRPKRQLVSLLLLALTLVGLAAPAAAQDDPIRLQAEVGFDNLYKRGHWTPVRITVANSGPDVEGLLVLDYPAGSGGDQIRYQAPLSLPGQSRKTVTLYVGPDGYSTIWTVQLFAGGELLAQARVQPRSLNPEQTLYAVAGGTPIDLTVLEEINRDATVATIDLDDLPAAAPAWESLDLLVLNDLDTGALTPDRRTALERWVAAGGHLVVAGGPNWRLTAAGVADLLPVRITGDVTAYGLSALDALAAATVGTGPFLVAQASLTDGIALIDQDGLPLLARRQVGLGRVDWLALDLSLAPLRDWAGNRPLWERVLPAADLRPPWARTTINIWAARQGLRSLPALALPSALEMVGFFLAYTLVVGPLNYFVLKRLGRRELAWVTIPGVIVLFSALAYLTGFQLRGGDLIFNRLSLVYGAAGAEQAHARTLIGVYSPRRDAYDLTLSEGVFARPLVTDNTGGLSSVSAATVEQSGRFALRHVQIDVAGLRAFRAEAAIPSPPIASTLAITVADPPRLRGTLTNQGDFTLQDASLLVGENLIEVGDLAPGATVRVDEGLANARSTAGRSAIVGASSAVWPSSAPYYGGTLPIATLTGGTDYNADPETSRRYQILNAFGVGQGPGTGLLPQGATLIGWTDRIPWEIEVTGRTSQVVDTTGYFIQLPLAIGGDAQVWTLPPALTTWQMVAGQPQGSSGPYDFFLAGDWVSFEYRPWDALQLQAVDELILTVRFSGTYAGLTASLWDWGAEQWVEQLTLAPGDMVIDEPGRFVGPNHAVRVRIENRSLTGIPIERVDVTYRGSAP